MPELPEAASDQAQLARGEGNRVESAKADEAAATPVPSAPDQGRSHATVAGAERHLPSVAAPAPSVTPQQASHQQVMRSEEHTSELQSLMRISYAVFCLKKKQQIMTYE